MSGDHLGAKRADYKRDMEAKARKSYDAKQLGAVLVTCATCGRAYYMTAPAPVCLACREAKS